MSFDRSTLIEARREHGTVARVVVARVRGSAPRKIGAAMLVWADCATGTVGGGTLEHAAMEAARQTLTPGTLLLTRHALGPDLSQCCGGAVELLTQVFDRAQAESLPEDLILSGDGDMPLAVARIKADARSTGNRPKPQLVAGWMIEPVSKPERHIWICGAGHVGRAMVSVISPLPDIQVTWVDIAADRFPPKVPEGVDAVTAHAPEALIRFAPADAEHLTVTFSHDLDLTLCHGLLGHEFGFTGLIGSATKWARFRSRLRALGHSSQAIVRITCPIGDPTISKHPQTIANGVGTQLLRHDRSQKSMENIA